MSSDLFLLDECFDHHQHSAPAALINPENASSLSESGPFSALFDISLDSIFQEISEQPNPNPNSTTNPISITQTSETRNPRSESQVRSIEQSAQALFSNSPPIHQLEGLSLSQQTHFANLPNPSNFSNGFVGGNVSSIKTEDPAYFVGGHSYGGHNGATISHLQRSYSCGTHSCEEKPWLRFQPSYHSVTGSPAFLGSESNFKIDQFRRTYSTGDISMVKRDSFSKLTLVDEANIRAEKYSAEERKERIEKYRAKRSLRNFGKTIKYVCRKTLAENRPRVRGRFARSDEIRGTPSSAPCANRLGNGDDALVEKLHEPDEEGQLLGQFGGSFE